MPRPRQRPTPSTYRKKLFVDAGSSSLSAPKGIDYTPMGADKERYKFFCPLCMCHFPEIYGSLCCSNYICHSCVMEYTETNDSAAVSCPHCCANQLQVRDMG